MFGDLSFVGRDRTAGVAGGILSQSEQRLTLDFFSFHHINQSNESSPESNEVYVRLVSPEEMKRMLAGAIIVAFQYIGYRSKRRPPDLPNR